MSIFKTVLMSVAALGFALQPALAQSQNSDADQTAPAPAGVINKAGQEDESLLDGLEDEEIALILGTGAVILLGLLLSDGDETTSTTSTTSP